jgi:hypothetical protein
MVKDFINENQAYAKTFDKGHLEIQPSKAYLVGGCLVPLGFLSGFDKFFSNLYGCPCPVGNILLVTLT